MLLRLAGVLFLETRFEFPLERDTRLFFAMPRCEFEVLLRMERFAVFPRVTFLLRTELLRLTAFESLEDFAIPRVVVVPLEIVFRFELPRTVFLFTVVRSFFFAIPLEFPRAVFPLFVVRATAVFTRLGL